MLVHKLVNWLMTATIIIPTPGGLFRAWEVANGNTWRIRSM